MRKFFGKKIFYLTNLGILTIVSDELVITAPPVAITVAEVHKAPCEERLQDHYHEPYHSHGSKDAGCSKNPVGPMWTIFDLESIRIFGFI